jgi:hypothetical protein
MFFTWLSIYVADLIQMKKYLKRLLFRFINAYGDVEFFCCVAGGWLQASAPSLHFT